MSQKLSSLPELQQIIPFSTKIFVTQIEDYSYLIDSIKEIETKTPGKNISNKGGWQSPSYNYDSLNFMRSCIDNITMYVDEVYAYMNIEKTPHLSNYWFNINHKHDYNVTHRHGQCFYSCVLYLKTPKHCGDIVFERPDFAHDWIPYASPYNDGDYGSYRIYPKENKLVIFPSFIPHYVEQNMTEDKDDERISIALNFK